jgi:hypothetical protein
VQPLKAYLPGILSHCQWPSGTNLGEGINNKIKVIKRMACGYRNDAYFLVLHASAGDAACGRQGLPAFVHERPRLLASAWRISCLSHGDSE